MQRHLQSEYAMLKQGYWGKHFWASGCTGNITEEMVQEYLEHHRSDSSAHSNFILE